MAQRVSSAVPDRMSIACARYFAADWEASSFLEFFVDLQGRVAEDPQSSAGRTLARLRDHSRFALQMTVVRSVDSFFAYVAEAEQSVRSVRRGVLWPVETGVSESRRSDFGREELIRNERSLAYGNVRQLDRFFAEATDIHLFQSAEEVERAARLVMLRNFIAHGRTFASDDLAGLVSDATSVGGIGLRLSVVREEFACLRGWVARTDAALFEMWGVDCPVTSAQLFETIARVAQKGQSPIHPEEFEISE